MKDQASIKDRMPLEYEALQLEELLTHLENYVDRVCLNAWNETRSEELEAEELRPLPVRIDRVVDRLKEQKGTVSRINRKLIEAFNHIYGDDDEEFADK